MENNSSQREAFRLCVPFRRRPVDRCRGFAVVAPFEEIASMTSPLEKKLKIAGPVLITANRLGDGAVIYRTVDGNWTTDFDRAVVVSTAPAASELLEAAVADDIGAVGAYVAPVKFET